MGVAGKTGNPHCREIIIATYNERACKQTFAGPFFLHLLQIKSASSHRRCKHVAALCKRHSKWIVIEQPAGAFGAHVPLGKSVQYGLAGTMMK